MTDPGHETIAAVATPPGRGALAVVRVTGAGSAGIAAALGFPLPAPRRAAIRRLVHPVSGDMLDRAVVTWFPAPNSYTGEDVLEISGHGGTLVPSLVLDAVCAAGARPAEPGEFTRRAYLNGKLDLLQAEAIGDLIDARSPRMGGAALFALERGLSRRVERLRTAAIELQALIAYDIDFPEEDDGPVPAGRIDTATAALLDELAGMLRNAPEGELLREGALTVIAGRPNTGKSSLFNALLGVERAIVADQAGTTRDAIEALVSVNGYPFRLVDTAGIRPEAERIESLGIEVARAYLERADLVIVCVEAGRAPSPEEETFLRGLRERIGAERALVVRTKSDLAEPLPREIASSELRVAATLGEGLPGLRDAMLRVAFAGLAHSEEQPLVTRRRHARALERSHMAVEEFQESRRAGSPPEIAVTHLHDAVVALEELLGVVTTEDVLAAVFSSFCVGK